MKIFFNCYLSARSESATVDMECKGRPTSNALLYLLHRVMYNIVQLSFNRLKNHYHGSEAKSSEQFSQ